jgi:hypothetical protein
VFFYTGRNAWLLNGRFNNLVYGSYAPGAAKVFLDDEQWKQMWLGAERVYIVADQSKMAHFVSLVGEAALHVVLTSGGEDATYTVTVEATFRRSLRAFRQFTRGMKSD